MERSSGILMSISSLPSKYGIGSIGKEAYAFADFLKSAGQKYWQVLPLGPVGAGNSPYNSCSSIAGNPLYIDLDTLIEDGLLLKEEVEGIDWGTDVTHINYAKLHENRMKVLAIAKERGWERDQEAIHEWFKDNPWIHKYADYMEYKFGDGSGRTKEFHIYIQFLYDTQWDRFKLYVNNLGIKIIGDIPIYVAMDSVDIWAEPEQFELDSDNRPVNVSGVPPDYFSEDGQLWGNPLYNYNHMKADGYSWWIRRVGGATKQYDVIRFDHFRGFGSYWAIPADSKTAKNGKWVKGPGMELVGTLTSWFKDIEFIAEDLGILSDDVIELIKECKIPGMKVLQFAFDASGTSSYLPHCCPENSICYTGTHDNATTKEWLDTADPKELAFAKAYLGLNEEEGYVDGFIRGAMECQSRLTIVPMQDWLGLGAEARMNVPGTVGDNWAWRMKAGAADEKLAEKIYKITKRYGRA